MAKPPKDKPVTMLYTFQQGEEQGIQDEIDVLFGTFAKSMASIGAFVCSTRVANKVGQDFQVFSLSDSNKLNSPKFSIQIGVFNDLIGLENPISKYQPLFYFQDENSYKYFVGNFENLSSAIMLLHGK
ncbi:hypothetical protein N9K77_00960 [bacterium]|nr:hypothetical protein [bacterium]